MIYFTLYPENAIYLFY